MFFLGGCQGVLCGYCFTTHFFECFLKKLWLALGKVTSMMLGYSGWFLGGWLQAKVKKSTHKWEFACWSLKLRVRNVPSDLYLIFHCPFPCKLSAHFSSSTNSSNDGFPLSLNLWKHTERGSSRRTEALQRATQRNQQTEYSRGEKDRERSKPHSQELTFGLCVSVLIVWWGRR